MNQNISLYKDGDDVIIVFKNASADLTAVITQMVSPLINGTKSVPDLETPPQSTDDVADKVKTVRSIDFLGGKNARAIIAEKKFKGFVELLAALQEQMLDKETSSQVLEACREFYFSHNKLLVDKIAELPIARVKGFLSETYQLDKELVDNISSIKDWTITTFIDEASEEMLRGAALNISGIIMNIVE